MSKGEFVEFVELQCCGDVGGRPEGSFVIGFLSVSVMVTRLSIVCGRIVESQMKIALKGITTRVLLGLELFASNLVNGVQVYLGRY